MLDYNIVTNSLFLIFSLSVVWILFKKKKYNLPPGPAGLPIVGYLPFMGKEPYKTLRDLGQKYGNVIGLHLGSAYVVICNDYDSAKEALSNPLIQDRPPKAFDMQPGRLGFASTNGEEWREQRRFTMKTLREIGLASSAWEKDLKEEISDFMQTLHFASGRPVLVNDDLSAGVSNNITSLILGHRLPNGDAGRRAVDDGIEGFSHSALQSGVVSLFPELMIMLGKCGLTWFATHYQKMKGMNTFVKSEVAKQKKVLHSKQEETFVTKYLKEIRKGVEKNSKTHCNESNLVGNIQNLLIGGSVTIRTTLLWFFLAMATHPDVQHKIHQEIESVFGSCGEIEWGQKSRLPFTYASIMESMRWRTFTPLNVARSARADTKIAGFDIPRGTRVLANVWWIHNDPQNYDHPQEFVPARFLNEEKAVVDRPENFAPFSIGKRMCPGEAVAMIELFHYVCTILQKFQILPIEGQAPCLDGELGIAYHPIPQKLRFSLR